MGKLGRLLRAFSLIELMVVVALVGILVSLALPRFRTFVARTRMAEATHNLGVINRLQNSYRLHHTMLGNGDDVWFVILNMGNGTDSSKCDDTATSEKNALGFRVEDCNKLRYGYVTTTNDEDTAENDGKQTHKIYPGCGPGGSTDKWLLKRGSANELKHDIDIIEYCN